MLLDTTPRPRYKYIKCYRNKRYLTPLEAGWACREGFDPVEDTPQAEVPDIVVSVEFFGVVTSALKGRTIRVPLSTARASTYKDLLTIVAGDEGSLARQQLFGEREEGLRAIRIIADGQLVRSLDDPVPVSAPSLRIVVLSAVGGG
jgi:hypothetical protein